MSKSAISVEGFVSNEPRTRTAGSHTVIDLSIPVTPQRKNQSGQWEDSGDTIWYKASFWDEHVPAILTTIDKGTLVTVTGDGVKINQYEKDGAVKVSLEVTNPQLAIVVRRPKKGASSPAPASDPVDDWSQQTPAPSVDNTEWFPSDETPF